MMITRYQYNKALELAENEADIDISAFTYPVLAPLP